MKIQATSVLAVVLFAHLAAFAQDDGLKLVDEFGELTIEGILARGDNYGHELRLSPEGRALIVISGNYSNSLSSSYIRGAIFRTILLNWRKISPEKITILNCDVSSGEIETRFYIAFPNAKLPECDTSLPKIDETKHFGAAPFWGDNYIGCCPIQGGEEAIFNELLLVTGKILEASPDSKVMLIGYSGTGIYSGASLPKRNRTLNRKPRRWDSETGVNKRLREATAYFKKQNVSTDRVTTLYSGYRDFGSEVEFWIIPAGGAKPEIKPTYRIRNRGDR